MNARNVAALNKLLTPWYMNDPRLASHLAEWLAARGVLAPNALTDEEITVLRQCGCVLRGEIHDPVTPVAARFVLNAIAKGEPVQWTGEPQPVRLHSKEGDGCRSA